MDSGLPRDVKGFDLDREGPTDAASSAAQGAKAYQNMYGLVRDYRKNGPNVAAQNEQRTAELDAEATAYKRKLGQ